MKVMKFGGTSVGSAQRIKKVAELVSRGGRNIVVLSAMSGTTNSLVEITEYLFNRNPDGASETIDRLAAKYRATIAELFGTAEVREQAQQYTDGVFDYLRTFAKKLFTQVEAKIIIGQGELLSTKLMELANTPAAFKKLYKRNYIILYRFWQKLHTKTAQFTKLRGFGYR